MTETSNNSDRALENYISQVEAARIRGVSKQAIADLLKRGRLTSVKVAGRILLLRSEVEAFVAQPKLGRPSKKSTLKKKSKASTATSLKK
ncbi:helix-turn-helix domain-containing protein [Edaphobacter sp. HDX4]|uniref:helix-turn-helix domain-containing protein n=1 Tax=Edaphobacter sp. HDX4 TaxID=2794064 RepID=UPI002FE525B5